MTSVSELGFKSIFGQYGATIDEEGKRSDSIRHGDDGLPVIDGKDAALSDDLPVLPLSMSGVSIDQLMKAIAEEARRQGVQSAVESLEIDGDKIATEGQKRLEEITTQLEKASKQSFWDKFVKAFKIIGAVFGVIASAATAVASFATGNVALGIAAIVGVLVSVDGLMSAASDGKISLQAGFTKLGQAMGMSDEAANWFGFGLNLAVMVAGIAFSIGASASAGASSAANMAEKGAELALKMGYISIGANAASGVSQAGAAVGDAALAFIRKDIADSKANMVDIDAILEQIRANMKMKEDFVEAQLKASQSIMASAMEIVENNAQTSTSILTGSPSLA